LGEHQFDMEDLDVAPRLVHRTAHIRLRLTRHRADRCYRLLRSAGDVWAWLLDLNRQRLQRADPPVTGYPARCRELTAVGSFGELSVAGARSVLRRYADAWHEAAKRRTNGEHARFPRRKRALVPVRFYHGTFLIEGQRVRLPVTAAIPVQRHDLDPARGAGVDLGIIHPYGVVANGEGLLVSGRAIRAENYLHLRDQQARQAKAARRAPKPGHRGSRRWRRHRARQRRVEARHRRRIHQAQHEAAKQVIAVAVQQCVGLLLIGDPKGITDRDAGRAPNLRLRQWHRTHLLLALRDKAEHAGIVARLVDERGSSSTCPACRQRVPKPRGRRFRCPHCKFEGHRDLVGAHNIAAKGGGGGTSATFPMLVEHRRAGIVPARRDRRRHLYDRRRSCPAPGRPPAPTGAGGCRSLAAGSNPAAGEDHAAPSKQSHVA
jgi:transposase